MAAQFTLAPETSEFDISLPVATDLSAAQYLFVKLSSAKLVLSGADETAVGVLQNKPNGTTAVNAVGVVRTGGLTKLKVGTAWVSGDPISSDASGLGKPQTVDKKIAHGFAIGDASAANDIGLVKLGSFHTSL